VADAVEAAGQHVQQEAEFPQERTPKAEQRQQRAFDIDDAAFTAALNESKQRRRRSLRNRTIGVVLSFVICLPAGIWSGR